jgi:hypothetical protein
MTAIRIIDRYEDLADVPSGSYSPTQINQTLDFLLSLSSSNSGSGDPYASYIVVNPTSSLPNARQVVTGAGIIITDNPSSGTLTFSVDPSYVRSLIQWNETPGGAIDGSNTTFTLAHVPIPSGALSLYYNGQLLEQGPSEDFVVSGSTITTFFTPRPPDKLKATYPK